MVKSALFSCILMSVAACPILADETKILNGTIEKINSSTRAISVRPHGNGAPGVVQLKIGSQCKVSVDSKTVDIGDLKVGQKVTLNHAENLVTRIYARNTPETASNVRPSGSPTEEKLRSSTKKSPQQQEKERQIAELRNRMKGVAIPSEPQLGEISFWNTTKGPDWLDANPEKNILAMSTKEILVEYFAGVPRTPRVRLFSATEVYSVRISGKLYFGNKETGIFETEEERITNRLAKRDATIRHARELIEKRPEGLGSLIVPLDYPKTWDKLNKEAGDMVSVSDNALMMRDVLDAIDKKVKNTVGMRFVWAVPVEHVTDYNVVLRTTPDLRSHRINVGGAFTFDEEKNYRLFVGFREHQKFKYPQLLAASDAAKLRRDDVLDVIGTVTEAGIVRDPRKTNLLGLEGSGPPAFFLRVNLDAAVIPEQLGQ